MREIYGGLIDEKIRLTIDDQVVLCDRESSILEAAKGAGIEIPTLCYLKGLTATGACGVCIVEVEKDWVPKSKGTTLYIRPFVIGIDAQLGVHPSSKYYFIIIAAPSGAYYAKGMSPVSIWVEDEYVRAIRGGVGFTKTGGNYAASLLGQEKAEEHGCEQTLWLDGVERKYIEEVGSMNIFFKIDNKVVTPMLNGSILPGVTRDSIIKLCKDFGYEVEERKVSLDELMKAAESGKLEECFGTGTACVVSPVGKLIDNDKVITINDGKIGQLSQKLYDTLTGIQYNILEDKFGWRVKVC